jgi:hypothetical protein
MSQLKYSNLVSAVFSKKLAGDTETGLILPRTVENLTNYLARRDREANVYHRQGRIVPVPEFGCSRYLRTFDTKLSLTSLYGYL